MNHKTFKAGDLVVVTKWGGKKVGHCTIHDTTGVSWIPQMDGIEYLVCLVIDSSHVQVLHVQECHGRAWLIPINQVRLATAEDIRASDLIKRIRNVKV